MKNKITVCAALVLLFAPAVSNAMSWGTEFNGASWTMDGKEFLKTVSTVKALAANYNLPLSKYTLSQPKNRSSLSRPLQLESWVCIR